MTRHDLDELAARARTFVDEHCLPHEETAERNGGKLPAETARAIARAADEAGLVGLDHRPEHGGQGMNLLEQVVVHEAFGRNTNGVWWHIPSVANVLSHGTADQIDRYLRAALRGERSECYAITEATAGSDPGSVVGTARRRGDHWVMDCEKWFSTGGDIADFFIVHVRAIDEDGTNLGPTLFLVDKGPGVAIVDDPPFTHTFPVGHPTVRFTGVELPDGQRLGEIGAGDALTNEWFVEERVHIAARCVGAMERLLEIGTAWALGREQFGRRIMDFQGVSFPLADAACSALSMKLLTRHVARLADAGADPKLVHGKASMAKLAASEAAGRVADAVVQVLGGRGYMRTNAAERLWREVRVDRIWEGTSEIQRLVVARGLEKRGVEAMLSL
ncbi:MAG: acyl-CoA dehydrogenase [Gaiellales bacterium]|nr:acyl-CoA dehydrogenase [Gaiellales bacterium]